MSTAPDMVRLRGWSEGGWAAAAWGRLLSASRACRSSSPARPARLAVQLPAPSPCMHTLRGHHLPAWPDALNITSAS